MMAATYDIGDDSPSPSDQEELLNAEESEMSTDAEEAPATCSAKDSPELTPATPKPVEEPQSRVDVALTGLALAASAAALMVLYPVYVDKLGAMGSPLPALIFPSSSCLVALLLGLLVTRYPARCPLPFLRLCKTSLCYAGGCLLIAFSQDSGRVPCHLQDPLKAVIILFSLLYYFFLCKKMLGLRKLFSASVMAVGLFIAADYGLCDEFKCRGAESRVVGTWEARAGWTIIYMIGLGLFTLHFTLTEEQVIQRPAGALYLSLSGSLLATVSRIVAREESCDQIYGQNIDASSQSLPSRDQCLSTSEKSGKKLSFPVTLWIQGITWVLVISTSVSYFAGTITRDFNSGEALLNSTMEGLSCHIPRWAPSDSVQHLVNSVPVNPLRDSPQLMNFQDKKEDFSNSQGFYTKSITSKRHLLDHTHFSSKNIRMEPGKHVSDTNVHKQHKNEKQKKNTRFEKMAHLNLRMKRMRRNKLNTFTVQSKFKNLTSSKNVSSPFEFSSSVQDNTKHNIVNLTSLSNIIKNITNENETPAEKNNLKKSNHGRRQKRFIIQSNVMGFKIIQPTDSILQGHHVITNKVKPNLIGHVILNKTDIKISGHKITVKKDLFSRAHDAVITREPIVPTASLVVTVKNTLPPELPIKTQHVKVSKEKSALHKNDHIFHRTNISHKHSTEKAKKKNKHHHKKHSKLTERTEGHRHKRDVDLQMLNDTTNMENFFKNLKMYENHSLEPLDKNDELESKRDDGEVITYEASESNFVRITDKKQSEQKKFMNRVDANVIYTITKLDSGDCARIAMYGWAVFLAYTIFTISSIRFLMLCQSSVFTIAMMTPALPLTGVWWALFSQNPDGTFTMQPGMSGELICALLGLPIVLLGLTLLFKAHLNQTFAGPQAEQGLQSVFTGSSKRQSTEKLCEDDIAYELGSGPQAGFT